MSGMAGGFVSVVASHPLDTVKARLQAGARPAWPGWRGAYAGAFSSLSGTGPYWASFYWGYHVGTHLKWDESQAAQLFAGSVAGVVSALALTPVDAVKVHAQVSQTTSCVALRHLLRVGGVRELFRPLAPTMARVVPSTCIWINAKEELSKVGAPPFLAAGWAGCIMWLLIMPVDTVKTRYTVAAPGTSLRQVASAIFREAGLRGFYRGIVASLLRAFASSGAGFVAIDLMDRRVWGKEPL